MDDKIKRLIELDNSREVGGQMRIFSTGKPFRMFGDSTIKLQWFRFLDLKGKREMTQAEKSRL